MSKLSTVFVVAIAICQGAWAQTPQWIWGAEEAAEQQLVFRQEFEVDGEVKSVKVAGTADNRIIAYVNGKRILRHDDWGTISVMPANDQIVQGTNTIAIRARNNDGSAGVMCRVTVQYADDSTTVVVTDDAWKVGEPEDEGWSSTGYDDSAWPTAKVLGPVGDEGLPWTRSVTMTALEAAEAINFDFTPVAVPAENLQLLPGFKGELLYTVPKPIQGSWVAMTNAPDGGFFVSDQESAGLFHVMPAKLGDPEAETVITEIPARISGAQGLLWAFDALYVSVNSGDRSGLYRVFDSTGDGELDEVEKLMALDGSGEHGPHAIHLAPDGKSLYVNAGNHTNLPEITGSRLKGWQEDLLLPRQWDARGHAKGRLAPGGWICKVTPDGQSWELVSSGFRNEYDKAFNHAGELFAYDADMEWDFGSPWYRPTRVCHAVSGSEFGWRSGTGKWPTYYEDSLPPVVDIGPGSPVGVVFGYDAKFPAKYQHAMYILDWTFGTIYAIHMTPQGASYVGEKEEFVSGVPLAVTDTVIGEDGAFYFAVGGRGSQSSLYRVYYDGDESTKRAKVKESKDTIKARELRHSLEAFHNNQDPKAVETAWPYLGHEDRFIRYAARLAIESQPVEVWRDRVLTESDPLTAALGYIALARQGVPEDQGPLVAAMAQLDVSNIGEVESLALLRSLALCFIRMGKPDQETASDIIAALDPLLPSESPAMNTELVRLLVYLDSPTIIEKGLALMADARPEPIPDWAELLTRNQGYGGTIQKMLDNHPPSTKIYYAFMLRNMRYGWTMDQRKAYFTFINEASQYPGGASFSGFLTNIRDEALANCSDAEKLALADITGQSLAEVPTFEIVMPKGPEESWTLESAIAAVGDGPLTGRNFEQGRNAFHAAACVSCHRFDGAGGNVGPDLSSVANKFSNADMLEAIIDPNKVISDQYGSSIVRMNNGDSYQGIVVNNSGSEEEGQMSIYTSDPDAEAIIVKTADVKRIDPSPISQMPEGLADMLSKDELLDLLAYLTSRGNPEAPVFK